MEVDKFATLDLARQRRKGFPEVVYAESKSPSQVCQLLRKMVENQVMALASRVTGEQITPLQESFPQGEWYESTKIFHANPDVQQAEINSKVAILSAGTSDLPAVMEAEYFLKMAGHQVNTFVDIGVAGIHRLMEKIPVIKNHDVIIVAAGMDGALPSVVAGIFPQPIIALPTSVGYGVGKDGKAALNSMLSSCAPGLSVVNIDNAYGAAMMAHSIGKQLDQERRKEK